jgi:hypothetical protein
VQIAFKWRPCVVELGSEKIKRTDLVETSLGRKDGDVAIVTCSSTHNVLFSCLLDCWVWGGVL